MRVAVQVNLPTSGQIAALDQAEVEARLRGLVDRKRGMGAWAYKMLAGTPPTPPATWRWSKR